MKKLTISMMVLVAHGYTLILVELLHGPEWARNALIALTAGWVIAVVPMIQKLDDKEE